ncbi:sulfatase family protein [Labilibaculum antarcticum]|uniref:Arylsulfatase n=1 Tax=Labilibaculum antarcticum TaxID=1717717 RepID=A0A1Y1CPN0_9BACT|nr:arylsulfatase [Labilibaculum antarcticum]BAX82398.1 arylsulfatase [Labilibaculum antarcticum]
MNYKNKIVLGVIAFTTLTLAKSVQAQDRSDKPNIVVIYVDDLGYGDVSCYGATDVQTPNVDRLAEGGIRFTDGHAGAATCTPSRFSLLTGSYAFRKNAAILEGDAPALIKPGTPTLPGMLQKNGYKTAVIGKWHLGLGDGNVDWNGEISPGPLEIGFDYSYLIPATGDRVPCVLVENHHVVDLDPNDPIQVSYKRKVGTDPTAIENPSLVKYPADYQHGKTIVNGVSRIGYMTGGNSARWKDETIPYQMLRKARNFIDESKQQPFFLYFAFHDIHVPRLPDLPFEGATDMGVRGDAIVQMDYITGELVNCLKDKGVLENTLIIFSSDNGPVLNDGYEDQAVARVGNHQPSGPFRGGKYSCLEGGTRVPMIAYWPKKILPGQVSDALFSHVDLYASIAQLLDYKLKENEAPDSHYSLETILGKEKEGRQFLLEEAYSYSLRYGKWKYIQPVKNANANGWIKDNKGIDSGISAVPQLFNLEEDPKEEINVADQNKKILNQIQKELQSIFTNEITR